MKLQIPDQMTAVKLYGDSGQLRAVRVDVPTPGRGEVLIKIIAAPVNPSDLAKIRHLPLQDHKDFIPGLEGCGRVIAAGEGVLPRLLNGRRVACTSKFKTSGTWAEYMVTTAGSCFPVKRNVTDEQAAMTIVNPMSALAFIDHAMSHSHKAVINTASAGALGKMLNSLGEKYRIPVINIVRSEQQARILEEEKREYILNSNSADFLARLRDLSEKLKATLLLDAIGGSQAAAMIKNLPPGSEYVLYGTLSQEDLIINPSDLINRDINVAGFYLGNWVTEHGLIKTLKNLIRVNSLLSHGMTTRVRSCFPLEKAGEAVQAYLSDMTAGKILLVPESDKKNITNT